MSKSIYKVKEKGSSYCEFRRLFWTIDKSISSQCFDTDSQILYTDNPASNLLLRNKCKNADYHEFRLSIKSKGDCFGFLETFMGCPYRIQSAKCISDHATIRYIDSEALFAKVKNDTPEVIRHASTFYKTTTFWIYRWNTKPELKGANLLHPFPKIHHRPCLPHNIPAQPNNEP